MSEVIDAKQLIEWSKEGVSGRNKAIETIYMHESLRVRIESYVASKGGTPNECRDVFVDSTMAFVKMARKEGFQLNQSFEHYFFGIAKYIWYGFLRKNKDKTHPIFPEHTPVVEDPYHYILDQDKYKWIHLLLNELDESCRKVLFLWASAYKMDEIRVEMEYSSPEVARKKKHQCLKKLFALIEQKKDWINRLREL